MSLATKKAAALAVRRCSLLLRSLAMCPVIRSLAISKIARLKVYGFVTRTHSFFSVASVVLDARLVFVLRGALLAKANFGKRAKKRRLNFAR